MKFKNILFISFLLIIAFTVSAVSAEEINTTTTDVVSDVSIDNNVLTESSIDTNIVADDPPESNGSDKESSIESSDLTKYYKNESQYTATFFDENGTPLNNTRISVEINGMSYNRTTNESGTIKFNINLAPETYEIKVTNPVTSESVTNSIIVLSTIISDDLHKYYKNDTQFYVTILNGQGNPSNNTEVNYNINGQNYSRKTNENGTTSKFNINLLPGEYIITITNTANGESKSNLIFVNKTVQVENIEKYYKNDTQYQATFLDGQGNPLANGTEVSFNINGKMYTRKTNENGTAKLNINLPEGEYTITATNPNTTEVCSSVVKVLNQIQGPQGDISIDYNSGYKYTVTVYDKNGTLAVGKEVQFNINGKIYTRKTNENGTATLPINLRPGNYIITAYYEDSMKSNNINIRITPNIEILTPTVKRGDYFRFRLTEESTGNPIVATLINTNPVTYDHYGVVYYNEQGYGAPPDSNGVVSMLIDVPPDNYVFYIGMNDDGYYSSKLLANTIHVTD